MEEKRGVGGGGGGGGRKGGGGMWDEEDEANNDNKKKKKNICILIWKQRGYCFLFQSGFFFSLFVSFLLPLLSPSYLCLGFYSSFCSLCYFTVF